ncbi:MAG: uracil-DNA glycosylase [Deltaproteobacteria bacterium]|nr:MAG: uracil-DNA glycosylase [Deltaproteobacteria bacterium]
MARAIAGSLAETLRRQRELGLNGVPGTGASLRARIESLAAGSPAPAEPPAVRRLGLPASGEEPEASGAGSRASGEEAAASGSGRHAGQGVSAPAGVDDAPAPAPWSRSAPALHPDAVAALGWGSGGDAAESSPSVGSPDGDAEVGRPSLEEVRERLGDCRRCGLCEGRTQIVFGTGDPSARLMFIGEGPGADEDRVGEPFVGRAGQLLGRMIAAMGLSREGVYIANVVKCRPPGNRTPEAGEVEACLPFLREQVLAVQPEVIVTLGRTAAQAVLGTGSPMSALRGVWQEFEGMALMPTWHPAYLLREPSAKKSAWQDLQAVMERLGLSATGEREG